MGAMGRQSSETMDASLLQTTVQSQEVINIPLLDPLVAKTLLREAFAFQGNTLMRFAHYFHCGHIDLANLIIQHAPQRPTRSELTELLVFMSHYPDCHVST
jgi:hypothetical protein